MTQRIKVFSQNIFLSLLRLGAKTQLIKYKFLNPKLNIIGISGSSGKTSTLNTLHGLLSTKYRVNANFKANSETGIPLSILNINTPTNFTYLEWTKILLLVPIKLIINWRKYDILLLEMGVDGIDEPKNMKYLLRIVKPNIAIYLNVDSVHGANYEHRLKNNLHNLNPLNPQDYEKFNDYKNILLDLIAKDKNLLISSLPKNGYAILNSNDRRVLDSEQLTEATVIKVNGNDQFNYHYPLPKHYNVNFEIALKIAEIFKFDILDAKTKIINNFKLENGRCTLFEGVGNSIIIDSSYNSSFSPTSDMIEYLSDFQGKISNVLFTHIWDKFNPKGDLIRVAVLGDMREIGTLSDFEHINLAKMSIGKVDKYFLVGPHMSTSFRAELIRNGIKEENINISNTSSEAKKLVNSYLISAANPKIVLVKGSQNTIFTEIIVENVLKYDKDKVKLCRRGKFWDLQRNQF